MLGMKKKPKSASLSLIRVPVCTTARLPLRSQITAMSWSMYRSLRAAPIQMQLRHFAKKYVSQRD
jgi:hypothetical protein